MSEPFDFPPPAEGDAATIVPPEAIWQPRPKFRDRVWLHVVLLAATIATTTLAGAAHYDSFATDFGTRALGLSPSALLLRGFWYSGTILAILGLHELGHYLACRYYDVDASLPFFMPVPLPITGTLGAFIRIREPIRSKRTLFDIGIAGPLAGFLVAVPALFIGISMSHIVREPSLAALPPGVISYEIGEPLLFRLVSLIVWGTPAAGYTLNMHPVAFGAWFGLLATALNLFPLGQLDGGHISYAVLGRKSTYVTLAMVAVALTLTYVSLSWLVWTGLMVAMLFVFGPRHPRTLDEHVPLDRTRLVLAVVALMMLVLCFTPVPIQPS